MYRITPRLTVANTLQYSQMHSRNLAKYQRELATGLKLHKPSDDPAAMERALGLKLEDARLESDLKAISQIQGSLNQSVSQLLETRTILTRARAIAIDATQPDAGELRDVHARELDELLDRLVSIANTSDGGRYLYGGAKSDSPPFVEIDGRIEYVGDTERTDVKVGRDRVFELLFPGSEIFGSTQRGETLIEGTTGARSAGGTDSGIGEAELTVRHTATSYAAGSGIGPGASSGDGDTIIGALGTHSINIVDTAGDGSAGWISLNGSAAVPFTSADANLRVPGANGQVIYVNTTAITPGFSGDIDIASSGTLSVDGGASEVPINFSAAQTVTDSTTGRVTGIDSRDITLAAVDHIEYSGTFDVFGALASLRDDLRNADSLSAEEMNKLATRRAEDFDRHTETVLQVIGEQSATLETLERLQQRTEDLQLETRIALGNIEGADLSEAAINLQHEQQLLEMTYASLARVLDLSLMDFLR